MPRRMYSENQIVKIADKALTPDALLEKIEGSETVVVDKNEAGTKVIVKLDEDYAKVVYRHKIAFTVRKSGTTNNHTVYGCIYSTDDAEYDIDALEEWLGDEGMLIVAANHSDTAGLVGAITNAGGLHYNPITGTIITNVEIVSVEDFVDFA